MFTRFRVKRTKKTKKKNYKASKRNPIFRDKTVSPQSHNLKGAR